MKTTEEKRIAIAEACGWTTVHENRGKIVGFVPDSEMMDSQGADEMLFEVPDYFKDLNAMHEAELTMTGTQYDLWCGCLSESFIDNKDRDKGLGIYSASAPQRAEAFGLTLGLWEVSP